MEENDEQFDFGEFPDDFDDDNDEIGGPGPEIPSAESLGVSPIEQLMGIEDAVRSMGITEQVAAGDGLTENSTNYDDTQIETLTDGANTVIDTNKLTITAGAGITATVAQVGAPEKGEASLAITNTDPGSSATDTKIGEVGDDPDTVVDCDKITFVGATVEDKDGGDALVTIDTPGGTWPGGANSLQCSQWIDVNHAGAGTQVYTLDTGDWRDRHGSISTVYFGGTPAIARANGWNHWLLGTIGAHRHSPFCAGGTRDAVDGNYAIGGLDIGTTELRYYVNWQNGHLELHTTATGAVRMQAWVTVMATDQRTGADIVAPD